MLGTALLAGHATATTPLKTTQVRLPNGVIEGVISADDKVRTFKGIPYAASPVGLLRWKAPQPAPKWTGIRLASEYGARGMQGNIYSDMVFHDNGPSENCLFLNFFKRRSGKVVPRILGHNGRPWRPEDRKLSKLMSTYWANFRQNRGF